MDVIGFGLGDALPDLQQGFAEGQPLDLVYSIEENTFRGVTKLQLKAKDVRLSSTSDEATPADAAEVA